MNTELLMVLCGPPMARSQSSTRHRRRPERGLNSINDKGEATGISIVNGKSQGLIWKP